MKCPTHPDQTMTLLLYSYVCDICSPPRGQKPADVIPDKNPCLDIFVAQTDPDFTPPYGIPLMKLPYGSYVPNVTINPPRARNDEHNFLMCSRSGCTERVVYARLLNTMYGSEAEVYCPGFHWDKVTLIDGDLIFDPVNSSHGKYDANSNTFV